MKTISAAEANRHFSQMLREVREGSTYVVTSHGAPVATLAPADGELRTRARARAALLARLKTQPALDAGPWTRDELYDDDIPADSGNQS
jgi:prevent-host-death family protein